MSRPLDRLCAAHGLVSPLPPARAADRFSVVVRTQGRRPASLLEALDSIADQTRPAHQTIVVVHGDDAAHAAVREQLADRGVEVVHQRDGGRAAPLNAGIDTATGDHLCVLDDDDLAEPEWLAVFARASAEAPGTIVRAVTRTQRWATDGTGQPVRPLGEPGTPYPAAFDLLAHMSRNETPLCSLAFPLDAVRALGLRFDDELPVYEDWDFLMRAAMVLGVTSVSDATTLYRRLDHGNADTAEPVAVWERAHARVIDRLSARPVLLPEGDARRLAGTHFVPGARSRHEAELADARAELEALRRTPLRRALGRVRRRLAAIRR